MEAKEFVNICLNLNLTQLVLEPTRMTNSSANILDSILTTHPETLSSLRYLREISNNMVIHSVFNFSHLPSQIQSKTIILYDKGNYEAINNDLQGFLPDFEACLSSRTVEDNWTIFKNKIGELARKFIPTTTFRTSSQKPWFSKTFKRVENKKSQLFRAARLKHSAHNWEK